MSANSRLTLALHSLALIEQLKDESEFITSERISRSVHTHAVVLRRLLGLMEKQGLVTVQRGSNAGWKLARAAEEITMLDVYRAVKPDPLFSLHHTPPSQRCVIGHGIQPALQKVYDHLQETLEQEMAQTTIADIVRETLTVTQAQAGQRFCLEATPQTGQAARQETQADYA